MEQLHHVLENVLRKPLILSSKNVSNVGETDDIRWLLIWLCERSSATKNRKRSANVVLQWRISIHKLWYSHTWFDHFYTICISTVLGLLCSITSQRVSGLGMVRFICKMSYKSTVSHCVFMPYQTKDIQIAWLLYSKCNIWWGRGAGFTLWTLWFF